MTGYESLLAVVYHSGPSVFGSHTLRLKIINMANRDYRILLDAECPISRDSNLIWIGFSEEGQLMSFDGEGVVRAFSVASQQWSPVFDFKSRHPEIFD
jgi:hypothetical protein